MPNLKDLRKRLSTTKDTKKIATAMTLVSSSKFRQLQAVYEKSSAYTKGMLAIFQQVFLFAKEQGISLPILDSGSKKRLYIVITSDRGLCGSFNNQVHKEIMYLAKDDIKKGLEPQFISIGNKGSSFLKRIFPGSVLLAENSEYERQEVYIDKILDYIATVGIKNSYVVFNKFLSSVKQIPVCKSLAVEKRDNSQSFLFDVEPFSAEYIHKVVCDTAKSFLYNKTLESSMGEEGARMFAMDNATRNASKMIDRLTIQCNRMRQSIITTELTEIISGAEALE